MRLTINNNKQVVAEAENEAESVALIHLAHQQPKTVTFESFKKKHKARKKHQHIKVCEVCGKGYKGAQALGIHKSMTHGIRSKMYEKNRKYRLPAVDELKGWNNLTVREA